MIDAKDLPKSICNQPIKSQYKFEHCDNFSIVQQWVPK